MRAYKDKNEMVATSLNLEQPVLNFILLYLLRSCFK